MIPFSLNEAAAPPSFVFRVVGLFRMGFNEYDTRLAYVSLADAHRLESARGSVFGIELRFSDPHLALSQVKEVKRRLDAPYRVIDWKELNHNLFMALTMQKVIISTAAAADHRRRGVQHHRVAHHDRAVEGPRDRDPEVDGRAVGDGGAHLPGRRHHRGRRRHRPRASSTAC